MMIEECHRIGIHWAQSEGEGGQDLMIEFEIRSRLKRKYRIFDRHTISDHNFKGKQNDRNKEEGIEIKKIYRMTS